LPQADDKIIRVDVVAIVMLAVPMYEIILEQPEEQRMAMISSLEEMVRMRLEKTISTVLPA
jgi:hypothetical protein